MSAEGIAISIKVSGGTVYELKISPTSTILEAKEEAEKKCEIPVAQQRLIYKGRILKDTETLQSYGIANGHTIHIVRVNINANTQPSTTANSSNPAPATSTEVPPAQPTPNPLPDPLLGALGGVGLDASGANPLGGSLNEGMAGINFQAFQNLLSNPAVTSLVQEVMRNPTLLRSMLQGNPFIESMTQNNPMFQAVLNNPEILRAAMSPEAFQNALRMQQNFNPQQTAAGATPDAIPGTNPGSNINLVSQPQEPAVDDATRYAVQIQQLEDMGFIDREANIFALNRTGGDINAAISWLLEGGHRA